MTRCPGIALACLLALAACGEDRAPAPQPAEPPAVPATQPPAAVPAPAPEAPKVEAPAPDTDPDKALAGRVMQALEGESKIQAAAIDVTASGGNVTLWGTASSEGERERAARAAAKVDGVKSVDNKLAVVRGS
jgi:hypothetical protein